MHQYKTIAQSLLVLSILNLVSAAPVVLREVRDTSNDVSVVAKDVTTVSERRRGLPPDGTAPSQSSSSSSDGSTPHDTLPVEGSSATLQNPAPSSGLAPLSHLSATNGQAPVHDLTMGPSTSANPLPAMDGSAPAPDSTAEGSTSARPLSAASGPVPLHDSTAEGPTTQHSGYSAVTLDMLEKEPKLYQNPKVKRIAGFTLIASVVAAFVLFSALNNKKNNDG
jgi:hypothetical protein